MRSLLFVVGSFVVTILAWGVYGPVLHWGQRDMSTVGGLALMRPFVCVGLAYFAIGVIVSAVLLRLKGEQGEWTAGGIIFSLVGGALGALGALGIILSFHFDGKPVYVMPLVFGGAPVVNSFLTITLARRMKEIGPVFIAGLVMVLLGAITVLVWAPQSDAKPAAAPAKVQVEQAAPAEQPVDSSPVLDFISRFAAIALAIVCWGAYGPVLHKGQAAMHQSRLRPFLCVGLAYFVIAVLVPELWLAALPEASEYSFSGTIWSLAAGAAGAIGALGVIMAFNFGGKPVYVMPLVFGGAPVVNTLFTTILGGLWSKVSAMFLAGLILVIAGAAMVLVFAPKGAPPPPPEEPKAPPAPQAGES